MYRIYICDDDASMRELLQGWLERGGHHVETAASGDELLGKLLGPPSLPDLVISDIRMPGTCGLEVLGFVHRRLPDLPVILITAFGDGATHRRARQIGAASVLDKPFSVEALYRAVDRVLGRDAPLECRTG